MFLSDLIDLKELQRNIDEGFVRWQEHPNDSLRLFNYTEKAQYSNEWNAATKVCRGLIVNSITGVIVARPFPKFMNYGQPGAPEMPLESPVTVTDKMDGSLGILYRKTNGAYAVATRGSFSSDQAQHATELLYKSPYGIGGWSGPFNPSFQYTYLFEIIYPENRIVVDYGDRDELVLLGSVHKITGDSYGPNDISCHSWVGPRAQVFKYKTFGEALATPPRTNAEGVVVHFTETNERVKIKQADYVALHRIVTGLNARSVWEHMLSGEPLSALLDSLPDEFHNWATDVYWALAERVDIAKHQIKRKFDETRAAMSTAGQLTKKDFALRVKEHEYSSYLFLMWDGKPIDNELLKKFKPDASWSPRAAVSEDAA